MLRMLIVWAGAFVRGRGPFLLSWRVGGEDRNSLYDSLLDALPAAYLVVQVGAEVISLTDRDGQRLPISAYGVLTWRWGGEQRSVVLASRREADRRLAELGTNRALEFVSLQSTDGRELLPPKRFEEMRAQRDH